MDTGVAVVLVAVSGVLGDSPGTFRSCMAKSWACLVDPGVAVVLAAVSGVLGDSPGTFIFCKGKS